MAAPRDTSKEMTEQEQMSQSLVNNLPFVTAFFSLNVPAGLAVYWIINNILTTGITLLVRNNFKDEQMPPEVAVMMAEVDAPVIIKKPKNAPGSSDIRKIAMMEDKKGSTLQAMEDTMNGVRSNTDNDDDEDDEDDDEDDDEEDEDEKIDTTQADEDKKRKKRAASRNKGKKRA